MNITDEYITHSCTSCQMCGAVCARDAITFRLDEEGFYRPILDKEKCVGCGLCSEVCYKYDTGIRLMANEELKQTSLFAASALDDEVVNHTTSGGIGDLLARQLIREGYRVVGVAYNEEDERAVHQVASNEKHILAFRGSKYIQSYSLDAFREMVRNCKKEKHAVFGLPCQIYAITKYLEKIHKRDNCLLIDLYCHGCPSMLVWDKVRCEIKRKLHTEHLVKVNWRSKYKGWGDFVLEAIGENGKQYVSKPMNNELFDLFFSNQLLNASCSDCKLRGTLAYTDIRLGDFWGKEYEKTFRGMSGVSIVTKSGKEVFERIKSMMEVEEKDYSVFLPYQSWSHTYIVDEAYRNKLLSLLKDERTPLSQCVAPIQNKRSRVEKIKLLVKQLLCYMPQGIERTVKKAIK